MLHLTWVEKLLDNIMTIFLDIYQEQLKSPHAVVIQYHFDQYFEQQVRELESTSPGGGFTTLKDQANVFADQKRISSSLEADNGGPPPPASQPSSTTPAQPDAATQSPVTGPTSSGDSSPARKVMTTNGTALAAKTGPGGRVSRRARKAANASANANARQATPSDDGRKSLVAKGAAKGGKKMRKWGIDGLMEEHDVGEDDNLDYSAPPSEEPANGSPPAVEEVDQASWGVKTKEGHVVLRDLGDEVHSILQRKEEAEKDKKRTSAPGGVVGSGFSAISGLFRNIIGGKTLTKDDLAQPLKVMEDHLMGKNIAREAAIRLCQGVEQELVGKKTASFQSIDSALRIATEASLRRILTPTSSLDLLREIDGVARPGRKSEAHPYVISIVGVNGVGKSTNLSKICFFLLQNNYRVLIAACDTFRSGAVEQLRVHARNLKELSARENLGQVDLYERGYGKDAANVALDAVKYADASDYDVVLMDTAGRRHNDQRLMSSLEKFAKYARPHKIFMVGEALVGTDSVMQARNFNQAFGAGRGLDGFIISKCDTVGEMLGTLVSMVHATGVPVVFLGVGQHYGDLRGLNIPWAVDSLMK